nr:MAG TPA: minor capsid protein [Caudoviricetes sp.]
MDVAWDLLDLDRLDATRAQWLAHAVEIVSSHQALAADVAAEFCQDWAQVFTGRGMDVLRPGLQADHVIREITTALDAQGPAGIKDRIAKGISPPAAARAAREAVKAAGARRVREADRQTVMRSAAADPRATGWRRITHGGCKFCNMLAGRGEVYTADTVRFASHDHCRCTAVPAYGGPEVNVHQYTASKRKITEAERQQLKEYLDGVEDDGVTPRDEVAAAASAGGGPRTRARGRRGNESEAERYARQKRLWSDMSDLEPHDGLPREVLESHELDFLERFEARGERVRWVRKDPRRRSTNDFVWVTYNELVCELKATKDKYSSIKSHIQRAVTSARDNHGVVKDVFVIDLGPFRLSDKLRRQLGNYNANVEDGRIRRLFVLSGSGADLTEIDLTTAN